MKDEITEKNMIHSFKFNDDFFVIDRISGAVHQVDEPAFQIINKIDDILSNRIESESENKLLTENLYNTILDEVQDRWSKKIVKRVFSEVKQLVDEGNLFSQVEPYKHKRLLDDLMKDHVKALCLNISHACNMKCKYCFADGGTFGTEDTNAGLMNFETAKNAVDFLLEMSGEKKNCEIDFFGGEPLLNWDVIIKTVDYAIEKAKKYDKNIRFTLTTNGLLLSREIMEYLNNYDFAVVLSLDGRKEIHDFNRKDKHSRNTYERILPAYKEFVESRNHREYFIRGTFTLDNLDFSNDVLHLAELGFKEISLEPVISLPENRHSLENTDFATIQQEYKKLALAYEKKAKEGKGFSFYHFEIDLEGGPCEKKRLSGCGAGTEYLAVTPNGDIYPCHQFVGRSQFLMGNINESFKLKDRVQQVFKDNNFLNKRACKDCWAKFYCGGGCHANAFLFNGNLEEPYSTGCRLEKVRLECAIYLASKGVLQRHENA